METSRTDAGVGAAGCLLAFEVTTPVEMVLQVAAAHRRGVVLDERLEATIDAVPVDARELVGPDGGRSHLIRADPGTLTVSYQARVAHGDTPVPEEVTDAARFVALRPSRYCPADRMMGLAQSHFADVPGEVDRVRAICDYVWRHVGYEAATSGPATDAVDTLLGGRGVCRDFAHLVAALCRAVGVPARIAAAYAPGLSPMDFHAVVETAIDGAWWAWDATRLAPRPTLVRIATGRDAADTAFATLISGRAELSTLDITAVAAQDLPLDGHDQPVILR